MTQRESNISRDILEALRMRGVFCFKVHGGPTMMVGLPDVVGCADGHLICFETKTPEKRGNVSVAQKRIHALIRQAGGRVEVVCGAREAVAKLAEWRAEWGTTDS